MAPAPNTLVIAILRSAALEVVVGLALEVPVAEPVDDAFVVVMPEVCDPLALDAAEGVARGAVEAPSISD